MSRVSTSAYDAGWAAWGQFKTQADNPYRQDTSDYLDWYSGWMDAELDDMDAQYQEGQ